MTESILVALITSGMALVGIIFTNIGANNKMQNKIDKSQAVMEEKIENLREEVHKHNNFDRRITELETTVKFLEKGVAS